MIRLALYLGYWLLITAVGLELLLRLALPQPLSHDPVDLWRLDSQMSWALRRNQRVVAVRNGEEIEICVDARGDRGPCEPRPACRGRILAIGDSYVEAIAVRWPDTVWGQLERELDQCVHAAGVSAYNPAQYEIRLAMKLDRRPSYSLVILALYQANDFRLDSHTVPPPAHVGQKPLHWLPRGWSRRALADWIFPVNQRLEANSHAYVGVRNTLKSVFLEDDLPDVYDRARFDASRVDPAFGPIRRMVQRTRARGVPMLVVLIPDRFQALLDGEALRERFADPNLDPDLGSSLIVPRLEALGVDYVDLLPILRARADRTAWGTDDTHFNARGHALWFEAVREPVRELLSGKDASALAAPTLPGHPPAPVAQ